MEISEIFNNYNNIAVVGMSRKLEKPAFSVPAYMKKQGYTIIPVNPLADLILKEKSYKNLLEIPDLVEVVLVFRPSEFALDIVKDVIQRNKRIGDVKVIWLQLGIVNNEAKELAESDGIVFIQDKCMYVEHKALSK